MSLLVIRLRDLPNHLAVIQRPLKSTVARGRAKPARRAHMTDALRAKILAASLGTGLVLELAEVGM
jgi:hypothetical protein